MSRGILESGATEWPGSAGLPRAITEERIFSYLGAVISPPRRPDAGASRLAKLFEMKLFALDYIGYG